LDKTDQDLVNDFREGDDLAFVVLYNRHKRNLVFFCFKMVQDQNTAEDIAQEAFLKVYLKRTKLQRDGNFKSFIFTIARNLCLNHLRNHKNNVVLDTETVLKNELFVEDPFHKNIDKNDILTRALAQMSVNYRELLILREYEGFSYGEIAVLTNLSESAVKSKLFKARKKLREIIIPFIKEGVLDNEL